MSKMKFALNSTAALGLILVACSFAQAQATRTWVSGVGDDVNPCSRTAPCKTFAGAISKTTAGGEIDALDSAGYGTLTITKSITIEGNGVIAGVLASGVNGFNVAAGPTDIVVIRGITIEGLGNATVNPNSPAGIAFNSGGALFVEHCFINGFQKGIDVKPSANAKFFVSDTDIRNNVLGGIHIHPSGGTTNASIDHVHSHNNQFGFRADDNSKVTISNSVSSNNLNYGYVISGTTAAVDMNLENCIASNNGTAAGVGGLKAVGAFAVLRISNVTATDNNDVVTSASGGQILTYGNNHFAGNVNDGNPTGAVTPTNPR